MSRASGVGTARVCVGAIGLFMLPAGGLAGFDRFGLVGSLAVIRALAALVLGVVATSPRRPVS